MRYLRLSVMRLGAVFLLSALSWTPSPRALAQDEGASGAAEDVAAAEPADDGTGRIHFEAGRSHFSAGRYEEALVEFERAYAASGEMELQFNIALCHERLGNYGDAADHLELFVAAEEDPDPNSVERVANLRQRAADQEAERDAAAAAAAEAAVEPDPVTHDGGGIPTGAIVSYGVGGVGLVTFAIFGALALAEDGNLASSCGADAGSTCGDDDVSTVQTFALVADIGLGVAVAGAIVGTILLFTGRGGEEEEDSETARVSFTPAISATGGGLAAQGVF